MVATADVSRIAELRGEVSSCPASAFLNIGIDDNEKSFSISIDGIGYSPTKPPHRLETALPIHQPPRCSPAVAQCWTRLRTELFGCRSDKTSTHMTAMSANGLVREPSHPELVSKDRTSLPWLKPRQASSLLRARHVVPAAMTACLLKDMNCGHIECAQRRRRSFP